jgi:transcriptional regulator with XRE-family HTH domain
MSEIRERIKQVIDSENLTYSKFADIIGVQRSGISHILSGRNNPSLDVIQKILDSFNFINTDWLLLGKGEMVKEMIQGQLFNELKEPKSEPILSSENINLNSVENSDSFKPDIQTKNSREDNFVKKQTERIVIFYSDKTFAEYEKER